MANFNKVRKTFTESLTFSRALATFQPDADGLYVAVGTGEPRFSAGGLAIESGSTNMLLHCRDMTNAAWTTEATIARVKDAIGIDGVANSATTLTDNDGVTNGYVRQVITLSAVVQDCVASVYFGKTLTAKYPAMSFEITGARSDTVTINSLTGAMYSATSGTSYVIESIGNFWRLSILINNAAADTFSAISLHPALLTGSATGSIIADFAMIEQGRTKASSPIATTSATVTRLSEHAINALFSEWGRQQIFTLFVHIENFVLSSTGGDVLSLFVGSTNRILITGDTGSGGRFALTSAMDTGGNKTRYFTATSTAKIAISCGDTGSVIKAVNGASLSDAITSAVYSDITSLGIGRSWSTSDHPETMTVKRVEFWPKQMTAAELEALTTL